MSDSEAADKSKQFVDGFLMLFAEHARQGYRILAIEKALGLAVQALAESTGEAPPLLRGYPIQDWIDALYQRELEDALRKIEDSNPRLAAHLQSAMDQLHVAPDLFSFLDPDESKQ